MLDTIQTVSPLKAARRRYAYCLTKCDFYSTLLFWGHDPADAERLATWQAAADLTQREYREALAQEGVTATPTRGLQ